VFELVGFFFRSVLFFLLKTLFTREKTMSKKHKGGPAPIPQGNQSHSGPQEPGEKPIAPGPDGAPASEQDPKRRLGNYDSAGEHSIEQPDGKQGPNH
jgi:hypothetical protein